MKTMTCIIIWLILPIITASVLAQGANQPVQSEPVLDKPSSGSGGIYFALGRLTLDIESANREGIERLANHIRIGADIRAKKPLIFSAGLSGYAYDDNEQFTQSVRNVAGIESDVSSTADATNAYAEAGIALRPFEAMTLDLMAGYEHVFSSSRSIEHCSNCRSGKIDIHGGVYLAPSVRVYISHGITLSLTYQQRYSGDIENGYYMSIILDERSSLIN